MEEQLKCCSSKRTYRVQTHMATIKFFLNNLVIMYWALNSIYMQFEYRYPRSNNVSVDHVQLPREMLRSFVARGMYCLKFGFFVARGMYCLK